MEIPNRGNALWVPERYKVTGSHNGNLKDDVTEVVTECIYTEAAGHQHRSFLDSKVTFESLHGGTNLLRSHFRKRLNSL